MRNAFGRQIRSFEEDLEIPGIDGAGARRVHPRAVAGRVRRRASRSSAAVDGHPVAARQDNMLVISFHPEIAGETRVHELVPARASARATDRLLHPPRRVGQQRRRPHDAGGARGRRPASPSAAGSRRAGSASGCGARGSRDRRAPYGRAQETAQGDRRGARARRIETDEDLHEVRQSDAYRAARRTTANRPRSRGCRPRRRTTPSPARSRSTQIVARVARVQERLEARAERAHALRLALGLPALLRRRRALPRGVLTRAPAGALPDGAHATPGSRSSSSRRDYLIEGERFDGWALLTWNDQAHLQPLRTRSTRPTTP